MRALHLSALLFLLAVAPTLSFANSGAVCEAYKRLSHRLRCPDTNYLMRFGYRYCWAYVSANREFSPKGQRVLSRIRACLANSLIRRNDLTCQNVQSIAESSHVQCYTRMGFCSLSMREKWGIFKVAWPEPDRFFDSVNLAAQLNAACTATAQLDSESPPFTGEPFDPHSR
jgi:hypothetical protein